MHSHDTNLQRLPVLLYRKWTAGPNASDAEQPLNCAILPHARHCKLISYKIALEITRLLQLSSSRILKFSLTPQTTEMILPSQSQNGEDQSLPPPSYQDSVPSSQLTPNERPTAALYAPSLSSRFRPSNENERGSTSRLNSPNEKVGFPEPDISTGNAYSEPPPLPPKDKEKEVLRDGPGQRALDAFSSMVWGTSPTASTSRSPIPSGSTSNIRDPLNPSPSAFTRPTPKHYAYLPFQAMSMLSISSNLADGFPTIPPPINPEDERQVGKANSQHPFVSHDVTEEDWLG